MRETLLKPENYGVIGTLPSAPLVASQVSICIQSASGLAAKDLGGTSDPVRVMNVDCASQTLPGIQKVYVATTTEGVDVWAHQSYKVTLAWEVRSRRASKPWAFRGEPGVTVGTCCWSRSDARAHLALHH